MATMVTLDDGTHGILETDAPHAANGNVTVRLDSGRSLLIPQDTLIATPDGGYRLPLTAQQLEPGEELVIPLVAESLDVQTRFVRTGGLRVTKTVSEREEIVDLPLLSEQVRVERIPINRIVNEPVGIRQEGDTMIVPLLEEVLVVEKRLMLKEEIHIVKTQTQTHQPQTVALRTEEAVIEQIEPQTLN